MLAIAIAIQVMNTGPRQILSHERESSITEDPYVFGT